MKKILIIFTILLILSTPVFFATPFLANIIGAVHSSVISSALSVDLINGKGKVYIDGSYVGTTPFKYMRVPSGSHVVTIKKDGAYAPFSKAILFTEGTNTYIYWNLGPTQSFSSGFVTYFIQDYADGRAIYLKTDDDNIEINKKNSGKGNLLINNVDDKVYNINISKDGYEPINLQVHPQKGYILVVEAELFKIPFSN